MAASLLGATGQASVEKIYLSRSESIDPQTGQRTSVFLNPSGEADLTYTLNGVKLTYTDVAGKSESVEIYADYPAPPTNPDGSLDTYNAKMKESIDVGGKLFPREILHIWATHVSRVPDDAPADFQPDRLILKFNKQGRIGFNPAYGLADVLMVHRGGQKTLAEAIRYTLDVQIRQQMEAESAARAQRAPEANAGTDGAFKKNTIGFITAADTVRAPMCARLFIPAR
jgi:hypothetical protein